MNRRADRAARIADAPDAVFVSAETVLVRRRVSIERISLSVRAVALIACGIYLVCGYVPGTPVRIAEAPHADLVVLALVGALIVAAGGLSVLGLRLVRSPGYRTVSALQVGLDALVTLIAVEGFSEQTTTVRWPALALPIIVAAGRHQLLGAVLTWAGSIAGFLGAELWTAIGDGTPMPSAAATAPFVLLVLAMIIGGNARGYRQQVGRVEAARAALAHQAMHDSLTGLPNRARLYAYAGEVLSTPADVAVLILDLNEFKQVNDRHGHAAGDSLLRTVADRMVASVPKSALVARLGGDEFVVVLTGPDAALGELTSALLQHALANPVEIGPVRLTVPASIGWAERTEGTPTSLDALLATADAAMYRAKGRVRAATTQLADQRPISARTA